MKICRGDFSFHRAAEPGSTGQRPQALPTWKSAFLSAGASGEASGLGVAGTEWNAANRSSCLPVSYEHPPGNLPRHRTMTWPGLGPLLRAENLIGGGGSVLGWFLVCIMRQ